MTKTLPYLTFYYPATMNKQSRATMSRSMQLVSQQQLSYIEYTLLARFVRSRLREGYGVDDSAEQSTINNRGMDDAQRNACKVGGDLDGESNSLGEEGRGGE